MGYIQFDRVDVPSGNIVPLGELSEQLKILQRQEIGAGYDDNHKYTDNCVSAQDLELSIEEIWRLFMMSGQDAGARVNVSEEEERMAYSLDEELCGDSKTGFRDDSEMETSCGMNSGVSSALCSGTEKKVLLKNNMDLLLDLHDDLKQGEEGDQNESLYMCPHCPSQFKVKGYLTRHIKKHASKKEYVCPFWSAKQKCHTSGEFSRKDTFRAHLRSIHFVYPVGTPRSRRNLSNGCCAACYKEFVNNAEWLRTHIENGICPRISKQDDFDVLHE